MSSSQVGVVGLSHLGVVSSIGLASLGFDVLGVDAKQDAVDRLENGDCMFPEPKLPEMFAEHREKLQFTTDFSRLTACEIVLFGQDTTITEGKNEMDLSRIDALVEAMIPHLKPDVTILFLSQVPVGFTRALGKKIRERRGEFSFKLFYWVDVLIVGDAVSRFLNPGRIIVGHEGEVELLPADVQKMFEALHCPILHMNYESAELTKSAVNVFLATTVTFANALSDLCEVVGADMTQIIPALRLDKRIGPFSYVKPGLGLSGGHLERDLVALTKLGRSHGLESPLIDTILEESAKRYSWLTTKIETEILAKNPAATIAIWGLSYKKNTDDTHGAPSLRIIKDFGKKAKLVGFDPLVKLAGGMDVEQMEDRYAVLEGADGLLVLSDWDVFKEMDLARLKKAMEVPLVIDPLGVLTDVDFAKAGITYLPMGRARA